MAPRSLLWPDPRVKPPFGAAEVDFTHPMAGAVRGFWPLNEGGGLPLNLATGQLGTVVTTRPVWTGSQAGHGLLCDGSSSKRAVDYTVSGLTNGTPFTVWVLCAPDSFVDVRNAMSSDFGSQPRFFQLRLGQTTGVYSFIPFNTAGTPFTASGGAATLGVLISLAGTITAAKAVTVWKDGVSQGTNTLTGTIGASSTPTSIRLGGYQGDTTVSLFSGPLFAAGIWMRALSQAELLWLHAEPYAMLRPIVRRRYFVPAAAVAGNPHYAYQQQ